MAYRDHDPEMASVLIARAERASRRSTRMIRNALLRERRLAVIASGCAIFFAGWAGMLIAWSSDLASMRSADPALCEAARDEQRASDEEEANAAAFAASSLADRNLYDTAIDMAEDCERIRNRAVAAEHERAIHMVDECAAERETLRHAMIGRGPITVGQ